MAESWKQIEGWPYEVSNLGRVRKINGRLLKLTPNGDGYLHLNLFRIGIRTRSAVYGQDYKTFKVHTLVALAFIGPPPSPGYEVDHLDGDKQNNQVENLEWVTHLENMQRAVRSGAIAARKNIGKSGELHPLSKLTEEEVSWIRQSYKRGLTTQRELGELYGVSQTTISKIVRNVRWLEAA